MSGPYQDPKREVEKIFCHVLKEKTSIEFFPYKRDDELETPYGVVFCETIRPLVGGSKPRGWNASVRIAYISHVDEVVAGVHAQMVSRVEDALSLIPQGEVDAYRLSESHVRVLGGFIREHQDQSDADSYGDLFQMDVGVVECG